MTAREAGTTPRLILASASPRRQQLLTQVGLFPDVIAPVDIDETPLRAELPRDLATRLAVGKARACVANGHESDFVIGADTVVAVGRRILPKPPTPEDAERALRLMSGRSHSVITAVAVVAPGGACSQRCTITRVRMKRLSDLEISGYIRSEEWIGKAGGYAIQGLAGAFVTRIDGSYSAVVGLPVADVVAMIEGLGFPASRRWQAR